MYDLGIDAKDFIWMALLFGALCIGAWELAQWLFSFVDFSVTLK